MNGRIFINNSAIGLYPLMVVDRDLQQQAARPEQAAGDARRLARTLARFNHQRLTLTVNDEKARIDTPLLFVGNNDYRIDLGAPGQRESLEDGELCVLVMRKKTRSGLDRREHPRVVQPHAGPTTWSASTVSSGCGSRAAAASLRSRSTAKWCAPRRRSTTGSARRRCG